MPRCKEQEILDVLDAGSVSEETLARAYRELDAIHAWLGNWRVMLRLLQEGAVRLQRPVRSVLDIGCGQGALLRAIEKRLGAEVVGFDLRPAPAGSGVTILTGDAVVDPLPAVDVAVSVVMAHHLSEEELVGLIRNVARSAERLILLDLVRHPVPLALFRMFVCPLLSRVNAADGQTSIRRAYTKPEMREIVDRALTGIGRPVVRMRHTVGPFWIRQVVDICWGAEAL